MKALTHVDKDDSDTVFINSVVASTINSFTHDKEVIKGIVQNVVEQEGFDKVDFNNKIERGAFITKVLDIYYWIDYSERTLEHIMTKSIQ